MDTKEINITLTVAAWNAVLAALGNRPYAEVAVIIEAIKMQAAQQIAPSPPVEVTQEEV